VSAHRLAAGDWRRLAAASRRTAKVATSGEDDPMRAVRFALDGDALVFTAPADWPGLAAIARDPEVRVCVPLEEPRGFLLLDGVATVATDRGALAAWTAAIAARYGVGGDAPAGVVVRVATGHALAIGYA
jgi:general stress protein 26